MTHKHPVLGHTAHDPSGGWLNTGFVRFTTDTEIHGLCHESSIEPDSTTLVILAIFSENAGQGYLRRFIQTAQEHYNTIAIMKIWNPMLAEALARYGFTTARAHAASIDMVWRK